MWGLLEGMVRSLKPEVVGAYWTGDDPKGEIVFGRRSDRLLPVFVYPKIYEVIVTGAGHAGVEAALAAARLGCETLLLTMNLDTVAQMSCNPAIGGLAKGHLVREIDALGGEMGLNTDATGIQFRMLNTRKGPAVRAPRAQADKKAYQLRMKAVCEGQERLDLKQGSLEDLVIEGDEVVGVRTSMGVEYRGRAVVVTTGTFLRAVMHVGLQTAEGGRMGDGSSPFSERLRQLGFEVRRLKTGTPPRLLGRTIDFSRCIRQDGDEPPRLFSFVPESLEHEDREIFSLNRWRDGMFHVKQIPCFLTHTTPQTAEIIRANLDKSPLYCGRIEGVGPRYCPSLEDKIVRFSHKESHQVFLEPEGLHTGEYYINGCSTSLPMEVQYAFIRSIPGLEHVEIMRAGYAVEYDFCPPHQLHPTLQTKRISGLFFAGQINGTSGYEEAAAQGLIAGINAALRVQGRPEFVLGRHQAYIGVLIDDLITKSADEPYRMFTSRAEYRLILRQDNADLRLTPLGYHLGLARANRLAKVQAKEKAIATLKMELAQRRVGDRSCADLLRMPQVAWTDLPTEFQQVDPIVQEQVETDLRYEGYLRREMEQIEKRRELEERPIPAWVDYSAIHGFKTEAREKLARHRPATFGQASRISGVNPTDLALLAIWIRKRETQKNYGN